MKSILSAVIALIIVTVGQAQANANPEDIAADTTKPVKIGKGGEMAANGKINISPRLRNKSGASVFAAKFRYTKVAVFMAPGSHTIFAAGMNGELRYLFAIDTKGNKVPATYTLNTTCMACFALANGRQPCYVINCDDVPTAQRKKLKTGN